MSKKLGLKYSVCRSSMGLDEREENNSHFITIRGMILPRYSSWCCNENSNFVGVVFSCYSAVVSLSLLSVKRREIKVHFRGLERGSRSREQEAESRDGTVMALDSLGVRLSDSGQNRAYRNSTSEHSMVDVLGKKYSSSGAQMLRWRTLPPS